MMLATIRARFTIDADRALREAFTSALRPATYIDPKILRLIAASGLLLPLFALGPILLGGRR